MCDLTVQASHLPPAFLLVDDLESELSAGGSLRALAHHSEVPVA